MLDRGIAAADLASVKVCISGGAPLPLPVHQAFAALRGPVLVEGYGLTETSPVCFCNPVDGSGRAGTIGLPLPRVEARICAPDAPDVPLPAGARGELQLRGPNVMRGYLDRADETRAVLSHDGWLRTGDVGEMAADGYVTLVDRIKDLILCGGFNVYPRHVEDAIYRHPDVADATVLGMPDAYRGESVAAFVELRPGATLDAAGLLAFPARQAVARRGAAPCGVPREPAAHGRRQAEPQGAARRAARAWRPASVRDERAGGDAQDDAAEPGNAQVVDAPPAEPALYSVSQLAAELGITPRTIRFYEAQHLIAPRRAGTTRVLDRRDRARLLLILRGKRLGFSLSQIREYLSLYEGDRTQTGQVRLLLDLTRQRAEELELQRRDLDQTLAELRDIERQALAALGETDQLSGTLT